MSIFNQPPTARTRDDLIAAWVHAVSAAWSGPFLVHQDVGIGYEAIASMADVFVRLSLAAVRADVDYRLDTAPAGSRATVTLDVTKPAVTAEGITVGEGSRFTVSETGQGFEIPEGQEISWLAGETGTKPIQAVSMTMSYQADVRPGAIDTVSLLMPGNSDVSFISVTNPAAATGGAPPLLYAIGRSRATYERAGEDPEAYRDRARTLPDNITPNAIRRALKEFFEPLGFAAHEYAYHDYADAGMFADDGWADDPDCEVTAVAGIGIAGFVVLVPDVWGALTDDGDYADDMFADADFVDAGHDLATSTLGALRATLDAKRPAGVPYALKMEDC